MNLPTDQPKFCAQRYMELMQLDKKNESNLLKGNSRFKDMFKFFMATSKSVGKFFISFNQLFLDDLSKGINSKFSMR
jgi:hypothetical protein